MSEPPIADFQKIRLAVDEGKNGEHLPATRGHFSEGFYHRIARALRTAPQLTQHIAAMIASSGAAGEQRVDGSKEAPLPMNVGAFNDANEIYSRLVYFSNLFANSLHRQAPGPAKRAWAQESGHVVGLPADITPKDARYLVGIMSKWLEVSLEDILGTDDTDAVVYFHDELAKDLMRLNAKWPQIQQPYFSRLPCPDDKGRIAVYPPEDFMEATVYKCEQCGRLFDEEQHGFYARLFREMSTSADAVKAARKADRVRKGLMDRWANTA